MRLLIVSDIHANLLGLEAVLADARRFAPDRVVAAGDLLALGPRPNEVVQRLRDLDALMIRGNNDDRIANWARGGGPPGWESQLSWAPTRWSIELTAPETIEYVSSQPEQRRLAFDGTDPIRLVHGSPTHIAQPIVPDPRHPARRFYEKVLLDAYRHRAVSAAEALSAIDEPVLVCGHTHIPWCERRRGRLAVNAGSAGAPTNDDGWVDYALLEWRGGRWEASLHRVDYDRDAVVRDMKALCAERDTGPIGRLFMYEIATGHTEILHFYRHVRRVAAEMHVDVDGHIPDGLLLLAERTYEYAWDKADGGSPEGYQA